MKIRKDIEQIVESIKSDRENGATFLAGRGLDALAAFASSIKEQVTESDVLDLVNRIGSIRPSMGAIKTQALLAFERMNELIKNGVPASEALETAVTLERKNLEAADQVIAKYALKEMGEGGIIVTCSSSGTVKRVIQNIKPKILRIGEGYPLNDGLKAAKWFTKEGWDVEVVPDRDLPTAVEGARAALIGADQVLADGSVVNRFGSLSLAVGAERFNVPFYVVCQRIKLTGEESVTIEEYSYNDPSSDGNTARAPLFDVTPPELVTKIITELGPITPHKA